MFPLLWTASAALADDAPAPSTLAPIVVTATRTEKTVDDTPVRTEVVGREEISRTHARTLKQALENVPGLQLREVHGKSGYEVSLQGLSADQVLVLVDGLPLSASTGSTVDLSQYLLGGVERVEVVKGAASAQYGSAAMGGVINVITRRVEPGFSGTVSADAGSRGPQNVSGGTAKSQANFTLEGGDTAWRLRLSGDAVDDKGFSTDPSGWSRQGDAMKRQQVAARASWLPAQGSELWVDASTYREDDEQRYTYYAPPNLVPQRKTEAITRDRFAAGGEWRAGNGLRLHLKGMDERYDSRSQEISNEALAGERAAQLGLSHVSAQVDLPTWGPQQWQVGADWRRESLAQTSNGASEVDGGNAERSSRELFVQNDVLFDNQVELLLGIRTQDDSDFGLHHAPKLGLRAPLFDAGGWKGTLRTSLGQGYRVPNLKERHYLFDHSSLGYMVLGNPNLKPESSNSFQLGVTLAHGHDASLEVQAFVNRVKDLIQTDLVNYTLVNGVAQYTYRNVARARTAGLETGFTWQLSPTLGLRGGWTYTQGKDLDTGAELTRRPRQQSRLGLDWQALDHTTLTLRGRHQSSELVDPVSGGRSPSFATLDLAVNQDLPGLAKGLRVYGGMSNLTGRQRDFADPNDFGPIAGRYVYLGLSYSFSSSQTSP
jgi:outer membrane receptor for ferrienterochelin and colicins